MRIEHTALFDGAFFAKRTSVRASYSHAWRVTYRWGPIPDDWSSDHREFDATNWPEGREDFAEGFASTEALAHKAAARVIAALTPGRDHRGSPRKREVLRCEVVPAQRIERRTRKERVTGCDDPHGFQKDSGAVGNG